MNKIYFTLLLMALPAAMFAQLKVSSSGNVSVCTTNTYSFSNLYAGNGSIYNNTNTKIGIVGRASAVSSNSNIGVEGYISSNMTYNNTYKNYGVLGLVNSTANNSSALNFGVCGMINSVNGAGVFGSKSLYPYSNSIPIQGQYAGFFYGSVKITEDLTASNVYTTSDRRLKENIVSIDKTDNNGEQTLLNVLNMKVVEYNLKDRQQELAGNANVELPKDMAEAEKKDREAFCAQRHYGLIAQELQDIYPSLVKEEQDGYLSINYTELVPILIRSIQTLKQELDEVKEGNTDATMSRGTASAITASSTSTGNVLYQNTPNPFKERTVIRFSLADDVTSASVCIFDMTGKMLKKLPVSSGETSVSINGWELGEGMFLYTLIANGKEIDTKRMIITK